MKYKIKMPVWMLLLGMIFVVGCVEESILPSKGQDSGINQQVWNKESCGEFVETLQKKIDALDKSCENDSDCINVDFGCPIECYNPINKDEDLTEIEKEWKTYKQNCLPCAYKCPAKDIKCVNNKCQAISTAK